MSEPTQDAKPVKVSGRYRKVEVRIWGDEKFRALSPLPPCGQGLFLFLITGPHTGPVPGLFRIGRAAMAEELGWELEDFDKAFQEAFAQGLVVADFKARVMWVPNAIKHNKPESPNVVKSWASEFDLIPECDLKRQAFQHLRVSIHALGEAYGKAFDESFGKAFAKTLSKTMPNQEQEQEQEQDSPSLRSGEGAGKPAARKRREDTNLKTYLETCKQAGVRPLPPDHPIRDYCAAAHITDEMLQLAWIVFKDRFTEGKDKAKRQKDWPAHFANSVRGRWANLWFTDEKGETGWTSAGLQERAVAEARMKPQQGENP
jgi:hypothetical protein